MHDGLSIEEARERHLEAGARLSGLIGPFLRLIGLALLIALSIRVFLVQPFAIYSGSMSPALEAGDYVFVDKKAYGWTLASLPLAGPLTGIDAGSGDRLWGSPVTPGDVVVFVGPEGRDYVKRMVAGEGDRVAMRKGRLVLNGRTVTCEPAGPAGAAADHFCRERLPNGAGHLIRTSPAGPLADFAEITVPAGHYFMLGDNRVSSADSRLPRTEGGVGLVADGQVIGKASRIFFATSASGPHLFAPGGIVWSRIGNPID